jgi:hypothetical protein
MNPTQIQSAWRFSLRFGLYHFRFLIAGEAGVGRDEEVVDVEGVVEDEEEEEEAEVVDVFREVL